MKPWYWLNHGTRWGVGWWRQESEWELAFYVGHLSFGLARESA